MEGMTEGQLLAGVGGGGNGEGTDASMVEEGE